MDRPRAVRLHPLGGCHDIQVYVKVKLAAAACASVGQLWDIADPENPRTLDSFWVVDEPDVDFSGYRLVASWYTGGLTVIDFTQPSRAREVAFYDPALGPGDTEGLWSAYAYTGFVYRNGLFRGFDSYLVAPARAGTKKLASPNPQTQ